MRLTDDQVDDLKARNPVSDRAGRLVRLRRKGGRNSGRMIGPCPFCSKDLQSKSDGRFECDSGKWVCAVCADGGDVIAFEAKIHGLDRKRDFVRICDLLGGARALDNAEAEKRKAARSEQQRRQDEANARYRERERKRLYEHFWQLGKPILGTPAADYLCKRGLDWPPNAKLRFLEDVPFFKSGGEFDPVVLHRGPCMLAPILDAAGVFRGLHFTWIDLIKPKGKAVIVDPETGEVMPSKKARGTKQGGYIDLGIATGIGDSGRMFAGEGIETVLSVYTALSRAVRLRAGDHFRSSADLGNLGGRAADTVRHPSLKDAAGRARRVPGPDPDMTSPAMPVPDKVASLVILGDGDSDPFTTRMALSRACARHARPDRLVRGVFADDGADFNDMLMRKG